MLIAFTKSATGEVVYAWNTNEENFPLRDCDYAREYTSMYGTDVHIDWAKAIFGERYAFYGIENAVRAMQATNLTNTFFEMFHEAVLDVAREGHMFIPQFELSISVTSDDGYELGYGEFFGVDNACGWKE